MFSIAINKILTENIPVRKWEEIREFPSPNGRFKLVFYDPFEFAMGATEWKLKLVEENSDVTKEHILLYKSKKMSLSNYQPWSCDSKKIFLVNRNGGSDIYDVSDKQIKNCSLNAFPIYVLGSKFFPKYIISTQKKVIVVDLSGQVLEKIDFKTRDSCYPEIFWLKSNSHFFVITESYMGIPASIVFFDAQTNQRVQTINIDPNEIVPYEYEKYKSIARESFVLNQSNSSWCVGYLLDTWFGPNFDEQTNILKLQICRPISAVHKSTLFPKSYEVKVKDVLVEITIRHNT